MKIIDNATYWWIDTFVETEEKKNKLEYNERLFGWIYSKKSILIFITILFLVFFQDQINKMIFANFCNKLLDSIGHSSTKSAFLCIAALLVLVFFAVKVFMHRYKASFLQLYVFSFIFAVYAFHRFESFRWCEFSLKYGKPFVYMDIIFILAVYPIMKFTSFFFINYHHQEEKKGIFSEDNPVKEEKDNPRFGKEPENLAKRINEQIFTNSFTIGILGGWGSGKTSFINQLLFEIKELNKESIIIKFNAFQNMDEKSIIRDFFLNITKAVRKYNAELSSDFEEYLKYILDQKQTNQFNPFYKAIKLFTDDRVSCASDQYEKINKALKRMNRQMIISIDDLDRYTYNEIIEVLKIIRNTANFHNTVYLLACDKQYITNALKKEPSYNQNEFIQKFIQFEYLLKPINQIELTTELGLRLKISKTDSVNLLKYLNDLPAHEFVHVKDCLSNVRDIIKLSNCINYSYALQKEAININDFFYLKILEFKYSHVLQIFADNYGKYLQFEKEMCYIEEIGDEKTREFLIVDHIKSHYVNPSDLKNINFILIQLFNTKPYPNTSSHLHGNLKITKKENSYSINKTVNLLTYITSIINSKVIPQEDFLLIEINFDKFINKIPGWIKDSNIFLINKLKDYSIEIKSLKQYRIFIKAILLTCYQSDEVIQSNLVKILLDFIHRMKDQYNSQDDTLHNCDQFLSIELFRSIKNEERFHKFNTTTLKKINDKYHISENWLLTLLNQISRNKDETFLYIYFDCLFNNKNEEIHKAFKNLFEKYLRESTENLKLFLEKTIYEDHENRINCNEDIIKQVFVDTNSFIKFITNSDSENYVKEFIHFFNTLKIRNFPIAYEFSYLNIQSKRSYRSEIFIKTTLNDKLTEEIRRIKHTLPVVDLTYNESTPTIEIEPNNGIIFIRETKYSKSSYLSDLFKKMKEILLKNFNFDEKEYTSFITGDLAILNLGDEQYIEMISMQPRSILQKYLKEEFSKENGWNTEDAQIVE